MKKILLTAFVLFSCVASKPLGWTEEVPGIRVIQDCSAILSAIDSGKTIVIPQMTCYLSESLKLNNLKGVTIQGANSESTRLVFNSPIGIEMLTCWNCTIENIRIEMQGGDVGIVIARSTTDGNSAWTNIRHAYIYGNWNYAGVYCVSCESFTLYDSTIQGTQGGSNYTVAGFNEYGLQTSIPMDEGKGAYRPIIENSYLIGYPVETSVKVYGVGLTIRDTYIPNWKRAGVEVIERGTLRLENVAFEGNTFASVRLSSVDGYQDYFTVHIDTGLGGSSEYGIYADDETVTSGYIGKTGTLPLRFGHLVYMDLSDWALFDSSPNTITAQVCSGVSISLGQQDTLNCQRENGVKRYDHSTYWQPKGYE